MIEPMTEAERLVAVETKIANVQKTVDKIDGKLDVLIPTFATQAQLAEMKQQLEKEMSNLEAEFHESRKKSALQTWLTSTLAAVFGAVLMFLIQAYLQS